MKRVLIAAPSTLLFVCLMITALIVATPFCPRLLPSSGLDADPSWMFAVNQAAADGLAFGRQLIFTFGPYGAIYTRMFHPATDPLALGAGLFFGLCFGAVCILLARQSLLWGISLLYIVAGQMFARDVVFASYGLFLVVAAGNLASKRLDGRAGLARFENALFLPLLFALGLLPLIKGSLIVNATVSAGAALFVFWAGGSAFLAAASVVLPATGLIAFWALSGQSIGDLPAYFVNMGQIISGYTEAMASDGPGRDVVIFIVASAALLFVVLTMPSKSGFRLPMLLAFAGFLFSAFKGGFVRHDGHVLFAGAAIVVAAVLINLSAWRTRRALGVLPLAIAAWFTIDYGYIGSASEILYYNLFWTYSNGAEAFRERVLKQPDLTEAFANALTSIATQANLPKLPGTSDIYSFGQAYLLASGNDWHPRPVLQSYSAYTPRLAELDREHLTGPDAPNNIVFRLETIDDRVPSLDDGPSWPIMLADYVAYSPPDENDYLLLKRGEKTTGPKLRELVDRKAEFDRDVELPQGDLLYAQLDLRPSLLGRAALLLYKTKPLRMTVTLASGETRDFRIVSGMAQAGFLLSPVVENTDEFADLFGNVRALKENAVRSIRINGDPLFWQSEYDLRISEIDTANSLGRREPSMAQRLVSGPPAGLPVSQVESCDMSIDRINGAAPRPAIRIANLVSVDGWMMLSGKDGTTPDAVYLTLASEDGRTVYIKSRRTPRLDVAMRFGLQKTRFDQQKTPDAGFAATVDASSLPGNLTLGLARKIGGQIETCGGINISLFRGDPPATAAPRPTAQFSPPLASIGGLKEQPLGDCEGNIDALNGTPPNWDGNIASGPVQLRGWTTISGKDRSVPDAVFIRVEDRYGKIFYIRTRRLPRDDLKGHFGQPNLPDAGFLADIDTAKLEGDYTLGIVRTYRGVLERCQKLTLPVRIRH